MTVQIIGRVLARKIIKELKEIRDTSTMEGSSFYNIGISEERTYPTTEAEVDPFIKHRTELWRDSWIIRPLDRIIEKLEKTLGEKLKEG